MSGLGFTPKIADDPVYGGVRARLVDRSVARAEKYNRKPTFDDLYTEAVAQLHESDALIESLKAENARSEKTCSHLADGVVKYMAERDAWKQIAEEYRNQKNVHGTCVSPVDRCDICKRFDALKGKDK